MRPVTVGAIFLKFRGEMAHFWQGRRTGSWLTAARARLQPGPARHLHDRYFRLDRDLGRLIDRNGKPLGTDFSNVDAAGVLAGPAWGGL